MKNILFLAVLAAVISGCTTQAQNQVKAAEPKEVAAEAAELAPRALIMAAPRF